MSTVRPAEGTNPGAPARSLKDELASLKIDRAPRGRSTAPSAASPERVGTVGPRPAARRRGGFGMAILSLLLWAIPLSILGGAGYFAYDQFTKYKPRVEVQVTSVQSMTSGEAEKLLSAKGYLKSRYHASIGAKAPGRVAIMNVEEGTKVDKEQVIAELEHADIDKMLEMREATLRRIQAELAESDIEIEDLDRKYQRQSRLLARDSAAKQEAETAYYALKKAQSKRDQLQASLAIQQASIGEMRENLELMKIKAPFAGTVTSKGAEVGETIIPGGLGGTSASGRGSVATIDDLTHLEVETDVAENLLSKIAIGQPAEISVSAVPGKRYAGKLRTIVPMGDRAKGTVKVKVEIIEPDEKLFPELVATVHFLPDKRLETRESSGSFLFVTKSAIVESAGRFSAWVVKDQGDAKVLERREVEVLISGDDMARVEKGLAAGDQVVQNPTQNLREGERVKVAE